MQQGGPLEDTERETPEGTELRDLGEQRLKDVRVERALVGITAFGPATLGVVIVGALLVALAVRSLLF